MKKFGMGVAAGAGGVLILLGLRSYLKARHYGLGFMEWVSTLTDKELSTFRDDLEGVFSAGAASAVGTRAHMGGVDTSLDFQDMDFDVE